MKFTLLAVAALLAVSACSSTGGGSSNQVYGEVSGGVVTPLLNKRFDIISGCKAASAFKLNRARF